jgi:hypothetical protein
LATAEPLTCDKKPTLPAGTAGSPFDWLVGHEDDAWPEPERPATPQSRTTQKPQPRQLDNTRQKPARTRENRQPQQTRKTKQPAIKKRNAAPQANKPKTKTNPDSLTVTTPNPNPTG